MRKSGVPILALVLLFVAGHLARAQGITNSALRGQVTSDGQGLPGVTVELTSPSLQGTRTAFTSANGDYAFAGVPSGTYTVTFKLQGFETATKTVALVTSQQATLDTNLTVAGITAATVVSASRADIVSSTTMASTTFTEDLKNKLPITRTILAAATLSSGVSQTATNGAAAANALVISGAQSFDNVFTVDGAVINDNVRSTPNNLFVEDAIQETTTSVTSISAEFGRFTGGIVNTITKSGGNTFSGSFRTSLTNDAWSAITPAKETRVQTVNPRYEATLGGPIWKDHIWFFGSGRFAKTSGSGTTSFTLTPFETGDDEKRYQGKLTLTPLQNHTFTGNYLKVDRDLSGEFFGVIMDLDSLYSRSLPQEILTANYNGVLTSNLFVEALYAKRKFTFEGSGSKFTDLIKGTLMRDRSRGNARYNSPTFCGVCDPEGRDNRDYSVKATYFLSTGSLGSHNLVLGYDNFSGQRKSNNYQSGSNYRVFTTSTIFQGGDIFPVIGPTSYVYYTPIDTLSKGTDTLTHSVFLNDSWRLNNRLSFNLGVRYDKNDAKDSRGVVTANDSAFSPRIAANFDVTGTGSLKVAASYARYIGGIQDSLVNTASNAGNASTYIWYYGGPTINVNPPAGATLVTRAQALQSVFDWFFAQGCPNLATCRLPLAYAAVAGISTQVRDSLKSPFADEYTVGFNGTVGSSAAFRVDFVHRKFGDFYNTVLNTSTGKVTDSTGKKFDVGIAGNSNDLERKYTALQTQFSYNIGRLRLGGNWTWSHTIGNFDGEAANTGPVAALTQTYPEYKDAAWNNPRGELLTDQRHRVRFFATFDMPFVPKAVGDMSLSAIQSFDSGTPYSAIGTVRSRTFVTNPGYETPPASVNYYFSPRGAFKTDDIHRTDLALNYSKRIGNLVELFIQPQVINLFNNQGVTAVDTTIRTVLSPGAGNTFQPFNPFTTVPVKRPTGDTSVRDANWDYAPTFGKARNVNDYQRPREFLVSMGLRF